MTGKRSWEKHEADLTRVDQGREATVFERESRMI